MESLSSVRTILGIVQDILAAAETASQNKSRCKKVAERARCLKDILEAAQQVGTTTTTAAATDDDDAATRRLLDTLEEALQVVRRYQRGSSSFLRGVVVMAAGGRMADPLDGVEADIDRCILDLSVANSVRIARLETLVARQQHTVAMAASTDVEDGNERKKKKKGSADESVVPDKMMDHESTTATTAIGVPVCTAATAAMDEHKHEMVPPPPPCYGYGGYGYRSCHGYYWRNHGCACDCWDDGADSASRPYDVAFYNTQYASSHPSMFSDDDPNSCSIM